MLYGVRNDAVYLTNPREGIELSDTLGGIREEKFNPAEGETNKVSCNEHVWRPAPMPELQEQKELKVKGSFMIQGEAGAGKSSVLKELT